MSESRSVDPTGTLAGFTVSSCDHLDDTDRSEWDGLACAHSPDIPFLQTVVMDAMAQMSGNASGLLFLLVREATAHRLVGGIALGISIDRLGPFQRRRAHTLSPGRSDLTQVVAAPEHRTTVEAVIVRHLESLRRSGTTFDVLGSHLSEEAYERLGSGWHRGRTHPIREADLAGVASWQEVLGDGHQRREILRAERALERDHGAIVRWATTPLEAVELIDAFRLLHTREQKARGRPAAFDSGPAREGLHTLFSCGVMNGTADVAMLTSGSGAPIAGYTLLHAGAQTIAYRTAFDEAFARYAPGKQLLAAAVDRAIERGSTRFGFSWGDEPYKAHWSEVVGSVSRLRADPPPYRRFGYRLIERLRRRGGAP